MNNLFRFGFCTLAGTALVTGALALPPANHHPSKETSQAAPQTQSVSGKIASVEKNTFTLTVSSATRSSVSQDAQTPPSTAKTMSFTIDQNTTIEGKMKVGANADVTYRQDNGANIAISVRVTP
jgi:hypothetical protein